MDDLGLKDLTTLTASTITKQEEILNLLTLFTNHLFFRYSSASDGNWGMPKLKDKPGEEANTWSSKWNLKMFHWPELPKQLKIKKFTDVELKYDPVDFIPFMKYYQHEPNFDFDMKRPISFPNNIFKGLDAFYALEREERKVIDTAIAHSVSAIELKNTKKTLSVISAFTSIETMVNFENRDFKPSKCDSCGQLEFKISKKYQDYLRKYIGDNPNNKKNSMLYTLYDPK
jgi:hypothetical protein